MATRFAKLLEMLLDLSVVNVSISSSVQDQASDQFFFFEQYVSILKDKDNIHSRHVHKHTRTRRISRGQLSLPNSTVDPRNIIINKKVLQDLCPCHHHCASPPPASVVETNAGRDQEQATAHQDQGKHHRTVALFGAAEITHPEERD